MNITSIHLYSVLDDVNATPIKHAELNLKNVSKSDSYIIKGLSGLDVEEITHQYYATNTDTKYYNISMPTRTVAMAIRLNPQYKYGETSESLRTNLEKMISYTRNGLIELKFMNGLTHVSSLFGLISKFESSLFSSESEVQITFKCEQPFFVGPERIYVPVNGPRVDSKTWTDNLSSAAHGFQMEILFPNKNTTFVEITTTNAFSVSTFSFIIDMPFNNTTLHFSSELNNRYLYFDWPNSGGTYSLMADIQNYSVWPMMHPGQTQISIDTEPLAQNDFIFSSISYLPTYWSV